MYDNPFTYGRPITDPDLFYGRDAVLNQVLSRLRNSAFESTSIVGERRSGKTSVLKVLQHESVRDRYELGEQYILVFLDCSLVDSGATEQLVWQYLLQQVALSLNEPIQGKFLTALEKPLTNLQLMMLFTELKRANLKLVLLLDEFDALTRNSSIGPDFYASLRSLSLHQPLALVTASYADLPQTTNIEAVRTSPFFNIFHTIYLRLLSETAVLDLLQDNLLNAPYQFSYAEIDKLLSWAGPHPFYLKLAAHSLYDAYVHDVAEVNGRWQEMQRAFFDQAHPHFLRLWRASSDDERLILFALALLSQQSSEENPDDAGIAKGYTEEALAEMHHVARRTLRSLARRSLVAIDSEKRYHLFGFAFALWILEEMQASISEQQQFGAWLQQKRDQSDVQSAWTQLDTFTIQVLAQVKPVYRDLVVTWLAVPHMREGMHEWWPTTNGDEPKPLMENSLLQPRSPDLVHIRQLMFEYFSEGSVRTACFDLGIDYEALDGQNKNDKARELLLACHSQKRIAELLEVCYHLYPHVSWEIP